MSRKKLSNEEKKNSDKKSTKVISTDFDHVPGRPEDEKRHIKLNAAQARKLMEIVAEGYQDIKNNNALFSSILSRDVSSFKAALEAPNCDVNVQDEDGLTPLHYAAAWGARPWIRLLVKSGKVDYLIQDRFGRYAADIAIEWTRDYAVGRLLLKHQRRQAWERGVPAWERPKRRIE